MATVFLTGITGFIGGATAVELLADPRVERVVALVRARDLAQAQERTERSLARFGLRGNGYKRLSVIGGGLNDFCIGGDTLRDLTHVVHAAAHTSFLSVRTARETNIKGTEAVIAVTIRAPKLERFLFVSTAYRCGAKSASLIYEDVPPSDIHVAEYTKTKAEAEALIERQCDLPFLIARPSIVIGHTSFGVAPSASLFWYYLALARAGVAPFPASHRRDIVPADWVAATLTQLLFHKSHQYHCYHLSAGEASSMPWASIHGIFAAHGQAPLSTQYVEASALSAHPALSKLGLEPRAQLAIQACAKFSALPIEVFSNRRLLQSGFAPPPAFTSYLPLCIETYEASLNSSALDDA
jgi:thioester reductase-like protein